MDSQYLEKGWFIAILTAALGVSPLVIGVTLVSIGTDVSEIFNSLTSCALGHADIDIGDSVGSDKI